MQRVNYKYNSDCICLCFLLITYISNLYPFSNLFANELVIEENDTLKNTINLFEMLLCFL